MPYGQQRAQHHNHVGELLVTEQRTIASVMHETAIIVTMIAFLVSLWYSQSGCSLCRNRPLRAHKRGRETAKGERRLRDMMTSCTFQANQNTARFGERYASNVQQAQGTAPNAENRHHRLRGTVTRNGAGGEETAVRDYGSWRAPRRWHLSGKREGCSRRTVRRMQICAKTPQSVRTPAWPVKPRLQEMRRQETQEQEDPRAAQRSKLGRCADE